MAVDEKQFKDLRHRAEEARTASDRAAGQLEAAMKRLEEEFGCKTVRNAEKLVKTLDGEVKAAEADYIKAVADFEEAWGEYVEH